MSHVTSLTPQSQRPVSFWSMYRLHWHEPQAMSTFVSAHVCVCARVYSLHRGVVSTLEKRNYSTFVLEFSTGCGTALDTK